MHRLIITALLTATLFALTPPAEACESVISLSKEQLQRLLSQAEKHFDEGNYRKAVGKASVIEYDILRSGYDFGLKLPGSSWDKARRERLSPLLPRARRIKAIATIRLKGNVYWQIDGARVAGTKGRKLQLEASVALLQRLQKASPEDPRLQTYLAEGLALLPDRRQEALDILTDLAERDLIVTAHGYKLLADLHEDKGAQATYLIRCRAMAQNAAICPAPTQSAQALVSN